MSTSVAVAFMVVALLFAGIRIEKATYDRPLPANQYCKAAMEAQTKFLQANLNAQFGVQAPEETPSLDQVRELQSKCDENIDVYQVVAK